MSNEEKMLFDIGTIDFVIVDLAEYLDTHPYDRGAMEYFNYYCRMKNQMCREFSLKYYPLTKDMAESSKEWRWGAAKLPWEGVFG